MTPVLDVNCDMGESYGNWALGRDEELLPLVSSANVACGFHGGDPVTMVRTVAQAVELGVAVGAHPGLPDLLGFGRRVMALSRDDAYAYVVYQSGALAAVLSAHGGALHHVKPHGALYAMLNDHEDLALGVCDAIEVLMDEPCLYWPAGSEDGALLREADRRGFDVVKEVYVDLSYDGFGRLVLERRKAPLPGSTAVERLERFLAEGTVATADGGTLPLEARSLCVHGDGPSALEIVAAVKAHLDARGWAIRAPAREAAAT
jgi:UPF0271 protein